MLFEGSRVQLIHQKVIRVGADAHGKDVLGMIPKGTRGIVIQKSPGLKKAKIKFPASFEFTWPLPDGKQGYSAINETTIEETEVIPLPEWQ